MREDMKVVRLENSNHCLSKQIQDIWRKCNIFRSLS